MRRSLRSVLILLVPVAVFTGAVAIVAVQAGGLSEGPVELVWDKDACAFCRMHVGEPAFAAQLQTEDDRVLAFDDPGCLFEYVEKEHPGVHAVYFRHVDEERWIPADAVAFRRVSPTLTPMGYGLGAVDLGEPGAIDLETARAEVLSGRERER